MSPFSKSLCWASTLIALTFVNRFGLMADKGVTALFAVIPALWIATGKLGRGRLVVRQEASL